MQLHAQLPPASQQQLHGRRRQQRPFSAAASAHAPRPRPRMTPPHAAAAAPTAADAFAAAAGDAAVQRLLALPFPPVPPLIGSERGSFAEATITARLPAIMGTVLTDLALQAEGASEEERRQLAAAADAVRAMQAEMPADAPLVPLSLPDSVSEAGSDGGGRHHALRVAVAEANAAVAAWARHSGAPATWLQLPWLTVECYLYARLAAIVAAQPALLEARYDPFARQKAAALTKSLAAAREIAASLEQLLQAQQRALAAAGCGAGAQLGALFGDDGARERMYQVVQYALWGNKTDLSMLVDAAHLDAHTAGGAAAQAGGSSGSGSSSLLIVDDFDAVWAALRAAAAAEVAGSSSGGGDASNAGGATALLPRADIVLDNAGLELLTDLVLADYLASGGYAQVVVLHGKQLPWFVSDALAGDLEHLLRVCERDGGGDNADGGGPAASEAASGPLRAAAARWRAHLAAGRWRFEADAFWTTPHPFWWMQALAPALYADLSSAAAVAAAAAAPPPSSSSPAAAPTAAPRTALLVLKGDLNYRKLAGDCRWPPDGTSFAAALRGFGPAPLVSLRTLKADVVAGLAPGQPATLDKLDARWQVNGKFGVVQFAAAAEVAAAAAAAVEAGAGADARA